MSNLFEMRCPGCGDEDRIDIAVTAWVRLVADGTDMEASMIGDQDYEPESPALCAACGFRGTVAGFQRIGGAP